MNLENYAWFIMKTKQTKKTTVTKRNFNHTEMLEEFYNEM